MTGPFGWIAELADYLGSFFPSWVHVEWCDCAVLMKRGNEPMRLEPGITWYWRFWSAIYVTPKVRQTLLMEARNQTTSDGVTVAAGQMVIFAVARPCSALGRTEAYVEVVRNQCLAALCGYIAQKTYEELKQTRLAVDDELKTEIGARVNRYGVSVKAACLTEFSRAKTLVHKCSPTVSGLEPGEE